MRCVIPDIWSLHGITFRDRSEKLFIDMIDQSQKTLVFCAVQGHRAISDATLELGGVAKIVEAFVGFQAHLYVQ